MVHDSIRSRRAPTPQKSTTSWPGCKQCPSVAFINDDPQADLDLYGLQTSDATPELALSFLDRTNVVAGLQVGRSLTNYPNYAFARRNDPGNVVVVARDPFKPWQAPYTNFLDQHFISLSPSLVESITRSRR